MVIASNQICEMRDFRLTAGLIQDAFLDFSQPMSYSYSSTSNDSAQRSFCGMYPDEFEMYSNEYARLYSSSVDSSMSLGYQSSEQIDDLGTSLPLEQSWHDGAPIDYTEPTQSYGIPVPKPNTGYGMQIRSVPHGDEVVAPSTYPKPGRHHPHTELEKLTPSFSLSPSQASKTLYVQQLREGLHPGS
ncbi:hypothetical protein T310_0475 [Rasamsonia emersonii CBS 393.64]|uniref:Uncharacterized protein n=1 Tax=Rasamsonia emersonii (strain ATCC 16479 / CBS 393.64 / IMI 116815) TaxID=1408163 RepID=A0A0F4Z5Z3_RASE3|nr:hypothetical protein T310_0475 [Rasamsonia emersonii CBS 393.64]KKA25521.1 hypothetical protein T310_0475 [Rasamsonia emersonii CBS 393.64]